MARDSIINSHTKTGGDVSASQLSQRLKKQEEYERKLAEYRKKLTSQLINEEYSDKFDYLDELAAQELKYRKLGLKFEQKEREKFEKDFQKKKRTDELKLLTELHKQTKQLEKERHEAQKEYNQMILNSSTATKEEKNAALKSQAKELGQDALQGAINNLANRLNDLNGTMDTYATYQASVNARVQGSGKRWNGVFGIENMLSMAVGINPYVRTEDLMKNLTELVDLGIVYNLEQRAFLQTVADDIATTFDAHNSSMLRLIRLQQSDSTAARLGLEASLTKFFNGMFENTEYLSNSFDTVAASLLEASSRMTNEQSIAFEYVVQKWLGSLGSVGLSESTINQLASAIGYLGSGNISELNSNSGMQNLIVMAASRAGLSYTDMLSGGLTAQNTNVLMKSIVEYLQEIGSSSSNVILSQYAETFGVTVSDLTAAANLFEQDLVNISKSMMTYGGAITELNLQMAQLPLRLSVGEMIDNLFDNAQYSLATSIASNPALASLWKVTSMIESYTGGINIPTIEVLGMGTGGSIDLETTVENLMKLGIVGAGSLGMIGDVLGGLSSSLVPSSMLWKLGIFGTPTSTKRGSGLATKVSGETTSASEYIGNSSSSDMYNSTLESAELEQQKKADAKAESIKQETGDKTMTDLYNQSDALNIKLEADIFPAIKSMNQSIASIRETLASQTDFIGEGASDVLTNSLISLFGGETRVKVTAPTIDSTEKIASIEANVQGIYDLLSTGVITVRMASVPESIANHLSDDASV